VKEDDVNQREKVVGALTHMMSKQVELERATAVLEVCRQNREEAEVEFVRVLKAVYGHRAGDGAVYKGKRYYVQGDQLLCEDMAAEVLG